MCYINIRKGKGATGWTFYAHFLKYGAGYPVKERKSLRARRSTRCSSDHVSTFTMEK